MYAYVSLTKKKTVHGICDFLDPLQSIYPRRQVNPISQQPVNCRKRRNLTAVYEQLYGTTILSMTCCGRFNGTKHFRVLSRLLPLRHQSSWATVQQLAPSPLASYSFSVQAKARCRTMTSANERSGVPTVTAIAVSKTSLPSFSQVRPTCSSDKADRTTEPDVSARPSSEVVESALRSALGIEHDMSSEGTKPSASASVSADDPAIVSWSLLPQAETTAEQLVTVSYSTANSPSQQLCGARDVG